MSPIAQLVMKKASLMATDATRRRAERRDDERARPAAASVAHAADDRKAQSAARLRGVRHAPIACREEAASVSAPRAGMSQPGAAG